MISIEIVPVNSGSVESFQKIPVVFKTCFLSSYDNLFSQRKFSGIQNEICGCGSLDEAGKQNVNFLVRTQPEARKYSIYGEPDEFHFNYQTNHEKICSGDIFTSITPLTDCNRYGRGALFDTFSNNFNIAAGTLRTRWLDPVMRETFLTLDYKPDIKSCFGLNLIKKDYEFSQADNSNTCLLLNNNKDQIVSMTANVQPLDGKPVNLSGEFAKGQYDNAYQVELSGCLNNNSSYDIKSLYAGPQFYGYYNNMKYNSIDGCISLSKNAKLNASYRDEVDNLNLNPFYSLAPLEKILNTDLEYSVRKDTTVGLEYRNRYYDDRFTGSKFNYETKTYGLRILQNYKKLNIFGYAKFGNIFDYLTGNNYKFGDYYLSTNYTVRNVSFGGYIEYDKERDS